MNRIYNTFVYLRQLTDCFIVMNIILDQNALQTFHLSEDIDGIDHHGSGSE